MRKRQAKKMFMGYRLDVDMGGVTKEGKTEWLGPNFSFQTRGDAGIYRQANYANAKRFRVTTIRFRLDGGPDRDYFFREGLKNAAK